MAFETIDLKQDGPLATLTFNRPEHYNALNERMGEELVSAVQELHLNDSIRCVLLTGAGRSFHSGGDVKAFANAGDDVPRFVDGLVLNLHGFISRLARLQKPVVGAINGTAAGAGLALMMGCDLVVAREDAVFSMAYTRIGASPDGGSTFFLPRLLGIRRALELVYTNRVLTAQEALDWGLVNEVVTAEAFEPRARALAMELAEGPTQAFGRARQLLLHSLDHDFEKQLELETRAIVESTQTEDFRDNIRAFTEKRPFSYKGK